jgi:competence protein ComEC
MRGGLLYVVAIGTCAGVALAFLFGNSIFFAGLCLFGVLLFFALGWRRPVMLVAAAACAAAALGLLRADFYLHQEAAGDLSRFDAEQTEVVGVVTNDPERRDTATVVYLATERVGQEAAEGMLLVQLPPQTELSYGDTVTVSGKIEKPEPFETPQGRIFDYPSYLRARGVSATMSFAKIDELRPGGFSIQKTLFVLKHHFTGSLEKLLPQPSVSLLEGLLLGERRSLPKEITAAFVAAGLVHIVVLSGYNISIISDAALRALSFLPTIVRFGTGSAAMLLFVLMIGGGATAVRALIMAFVALLGRYAGRPVWALRSLACAGAAMVLWNPPILLFDPSFILSVLATFGLITLSPSVEQKIFPWLSNWPRVRSIASSTIAVQLFVLPALLYFTGVFSLFALPANIVVLPVVSFAMGFGFLAGVLGLLHPLLALPATFITNVLLVYILVVATHVQMLPFAALVAPTFPAWIAAALYVPLSGFAIWLHLQTAAQSPTN